VFSVAGKYSATEILAQEKDAGYRIAVHHDMRRWPF
jgi:hypothetical protein